MKAITLYQPWASLIADGRKDVETRPRAWNHRGLVAIHAAQKVDREACIQFGYDPDTIPRGAVLCVAEMVDCVRFPSPYVTPDDYGDYTPGRFGYILELVERFAPIPARGYQCFWEWVRP